MNGNDWIQTGLFLLRILLENMVSKKTIPVLYWENSLGRSRSCDIVLADMTASRDHAVLMRRESGWIVKDTESKSGTRVNGNKVPAEGKAVYPGDVITVGSTSLMLKRTSEASVKMPKRRILRAASPAGLMVWVTVIQLILLLQACFSGGEFSALPIMPFCALFVIEWGLYFYSMHVLDRVSFELETLGFLLSGISVMLLSGMRSKLEEGEQSARKGGWISADEVEKALGI